MEKLVKLQFFFFKVKLAKLTILTRKRRNEPEEISFLQEQGNFISK